MRYTNPILKADLSDPDVIRVGADYYMIASSFTYFPGIPILHSRDLAHWRLIGYAAESLPFARYASPQHKCGLWAPSLRCHDGLFYIYACTPDEGLFAFTARDPAGPWETHYVKDVTGWIDPCPLWDDDGQAYLLHAFANTRVGIKSILYLNRMRPDGLEILDTGRMVFDGGAEHETTEGPKLYKREGFYYILAPAGGVKTGWQLAMRAREIYGPYEIRRVLEQKDTPVNGPHQGGLVDTPSGQSWFIHFQDVGVYGRIPHLQPVSWEAGWPIMGDGGAPVLEYEMPDTGAVDETQIDPPDRFEREAPGLAWQWQANPNPAWYAMRRPGLRLFAAPAASLFEAGQFLSRLMQSFRFTMEVRITPCFAKPGDRAGIAMMGYRYAYLAVEEGGVALYSGNAQERGRWLPTRVTETASAMLPLETMGAVVGIPAESLYGANSSDSRRAVDLRMRVRDGIATFFARSGEDFAQVGEPFAMACGGWTGARPGIFCGNFRGIPSEGYADIDVVAVQDDA